MNHTCRSDIWEFGPVEDRTFVTQDAAFAPRPWKQSNLVLLRSAMVVESYHVLTIFWYAASLFDGVVLLLAPSQHSYERAAKHLIWILVVYREDDLVLDWLVVLGQWPIGYQPFRFGFSTLMTQSLALLSRMAAAGSC